MIRFTIHKNDIIFRGIDWVFVDHRVMKERLETLEGIGFLEVRHPHHQDAVDYYLKGKIIATLAGTNCLVNRNYIDESP